MWNVCNGYWLFAGTSLLLYQPNVPLIPNRTSTNCSEKGRLQLEIPRKEKAALVPLHRLNRDEKRCTCLNRISFGLRTMSRW